MSALEFQEHLANSKGHQIHIGRVIGGMILETKMLQDLDVCCTFIRNTKKKNITKDITIIN